LQDTSTFDRGRVTVTSFLAYFLMSAIITPLGIVNQAMATHFGVDVTVTTAFFSYLTTGILIGASASMFVYAVLSMRQLNVVAGTALALTLVAIWLADRLWWLPIFFSIAGVCCGLLLAAAVIVLTRSYSEAWRPRALLVTDSFYSGAGVAAGFLSGYLINEGMHWGTAYGMSIVVALAFVAIAATSRYPAADSESRESVAENAAGRWPAGVFVVAAALLIYIVSFIFVYSWVPAYAAANFAATPADGGTLVSRFFLGLFIGQLASFAVSFRVSSRRLVAVLSCSATFATTTLWNSPSLFGLGVGMFLLGMLSGGVLKTLLAYGTMLVEFPSTKMVSFLVVSTAVGSSLGPALSALVVRIWGVDGALKAVTIGYATTSLLVLATLGLSAVSATYLSKEHV